MLCQLQKGLKVKGDTDFNFIEKAILGGHFWALKWEYPGIFLGIGTAVIRYRKWLICEILWRKATKKLSARNEKAIKEKTEGLYRKVRFMGFDGNNESEHLGIAGFLIEQMGRFSRFQGRDLNSHCPSLGRYSKMLSVFLPIRENLIGRGLSVDEIVNIVNAK